MSLPFITGLAVILPIATALWAVFGMAAMASTKWIKPGYSVTMAFAVWILLVVGWVKAHMALAALRPEWFMSTDTTTGWAASYNILMVLVAVVTIYWGCYFIGQVFGGHA